MQEKSNIQLQTDLLAWQAYDYIRGEYEYVKTEWETARTTYGANSCLLRVQATRDAYAQALYNLIMLDYSPSGPEPSPDDRFKKK